jgi:hypothetical protein
MRNFVFGFLVAIAIWIIRSVQLYWKNKKRICELSNILKGVRADLVAFGEQIKRIKSLCK